MHNRVTVSPAIGLQDFPIGNPRTSMCESGSIRLIFVGRFLGWKGAWLAIETLATLRNRGLNAHMTLMGEGAEFEALNNRGSLLGVKDSISWLPWKPRSEVVQVFDNNDIMLFPSLHDSGAMVVLEAMARGLPVVCLKSGGPAMFVSPDCGHVVANDLSVAQTIEQLANGVEHIASDKFPRYSQNSISVANNWISANIVRRIYQ
ncbi:MAG: glycosyltransferase family 4 protein [Candidatus Paracaedibacteraceae bacterium]|nr:glycosyltransferase family 4 protein [Candidatus Paracaedibacteraceae bacterium]